MFIPRYWSEASHTERLPNRQQVTVRRFGWSSTTQDDAAVHARQRLEEALAALREGGPDALRDFTRRERKVAYAGSDGLPIREEIIQEWPEEDVVVTRNSYGALCLNTTRAMFVDVDRPESKEGGYGCLGALVGILLGGIGGPLVLDLPWFLAALAGLLVGTWLGVRIGRFRHRADPRGRDLLGWTRGRTLTWCAANPDWRVALYETPAGARLLPVHATFDAGDESSFDFMEHVGVDPLYARMCRLQKCFRARVSPKPWRAGIADHFRAGGTWPVKDPHKLAQRADWVETYDEAAKDFASCRLVETVGDGSPSPQVEAVRRLHDDLCRAESGFDLA